MTADDQAAGTDLAEAERTVRADHREVCRWPHNDQPGHCVGECEMVCYADGEVWPCANDRVLAEYARRGTEIERLVAAVGSESSAKVSGFLTADVWKSRHDTVVAAVRALADKAERERFVMYGGGRAPGSVPSADVLAVLDGPAEAPPAASDLQVAADSGANAEPGYQRIADAIQRLCEESAEVQIQLRPVAAGVTEWIGDQYLRIAQILDRAGLIDWSAFADGPAEAAEPDDDPIVEAPGFGVTNREYWPTSWVKAHEAEQVAEAAEPAPADDMVTGDWPAPVGAATHDLGADDDPTEEGERCDVYVRLGEGEVARTLESAYGTAIDVTAKGDVVGIECIGALAVEINGQRVDRGSVTTTPDELVAAANELRKYWRDWTQERRERVRDASRYVYAACERVVAAAAEVPAVTTTPDPARARLREVLDALGMAATRDWDDVLNALRCMRKSTGVTTTPDPAARPIDCGESTQVWTPCPDCPQAAAGQPCPCAGAWCCERHRAVDAIDDALIAEGGELLDGDVSGLAAEAAVKCLLARPDLLAALAGSDTEDEDPS